MQGLSTKPFISKCIIFALIFDMVHFSCQIDLRDHHSGPCSRASAVRIVARGKWRVTNSHSEFEAQRQKPFCRNQVSFDIVLVGLLPS